MGHAVKRKEDLRFIQGKGNYVDDVRLPGMVYGHMVRSPYGHARLKSIRTEEATRLPGVLAVITGQDLEKTGLAWMPTLFHDKQMVLATGKVLFQSQEVAFVVAEDRYTAADAAELIEVEYEDLPVLVDPHRALDPDAPILREDKKTNHIFHWEVGDRQATEQALQSAPVKAKLDAVFPRCHPAPLETCGCVADYDAATGKLTVWVTSQAPHAHKTLFAIIAGLPENNIRVIAPDIGGGFGNKVPIYPGYVCAVVASLTLKRPVKWIETRSENLQATGFARDYHMMAEIAADREGKVTALRVKALADHGAFNAAAQPSMFPAGLFSICTGSYDFSTAFCEVDGVYTNKAPGGIAYRCSFRVAEAAYLIERAMDALACELKMDPAELRLKSFIASNKFPYRSPLGWTYDSGNYEAAMKLALQRVGYGALRKEQEEKRQRGELMGIGISSFTGIAGAGPAQTFDIAGLKMVDSCEIAACTNLSPSMEAGLEAVHYYDPPNLTFPFGTYICVVDIDRGTGEVKVRRFVAVDDCGNIINPMIVEGQIHGGLTEGLAIAFMQEISYDEVGNVQGGTFMDYLVPTAVETPTWETDKTCTPSPHHPIGAKGVGESSNVGSPAAFVNAVVDALSHLGVRHIDMPIAPWKVWQILKDKGVTE